MKYDWIFFDLDNTLMDFSVAARKAFSYSFSSFGLREEEGHHDVFEIINKGVWKNFEHGLIDATTLRRKRFDDFFMTSGIKGIDAWEFNATYLNYLIEFSTMLDGSIDLLNHYHGQVNMAIITNGLKEAQRPRIKRLDIEKYFSAIIVSDEEGVSKPHKAYFDIAMKACGFPKKEKVLVVGDSLNSDMKGGLDYNLETCWCNLSKSNNNTDIRPNFEIHNLHQLKEITKRD